ncbi:MAG: CPBP family intramembrane metalloprotease [Candidatus Aminicenantes bacterium]|jgi:hypothetical protein
MNDIEYGIEKKTVESEDPEFLTIFQIIVKTMKRLTDKTALLLFSTFILLMLWGSGGDMEILANIFGDKWTEVLFRGVAWHRQLASFIVGFLLLVIVPCCIIKFIFKERLSEYGLGWPKDKNRRKQSVIAFFLIMGIAVIPFFLSALHPEMQREYPLFGDVIAKGDWGAFVVYELVYLLFFVVIDFIYRGYLLLGLFKMKDMEAFKGIKGIKGPLVFGIYAIFIQMLSYTMWHIAKPTPELMGTIFWGIGTGAVVLKTRTVWPVIISHWLLCVLLDIVVWLRLG